MAHWKLTRGSPNGLRRKREKGHVTEGYHKQGKTCDHLDLPIGKREETVHSLKKKPAGLVSRQRRNHDPKRREKKRVLRNVDLRGGLSRRGMEKTWGTPGAVLLAGRGLWLGTLRELEEEVKL